jgi:protein subunit release factor A
LVDSLAGLRAEHASLQEQLSDSAVHTNPGLAKKINRRYAELSAIIGADELKSCLAHGTRCQKCEPSTGGGGGSVAYPSQ